MHCFPTKSFALSFFVLAAAAMLSIEVTTAHARTAVARPVAPVRHQVAPPLHEANADTDIGPGLAEPLLVSSPDVRAR